MSAGEQIRDYLPIEEVGELLVRLTLLGRDVGIVNICSGQPRSMRRRSSKAGCVTAGGWITLRLGRYPYPDDTSPSLFGAAPKTARGSQRDKTV